MAALFAVICCVMSSLFASRLDRDKQTPISKALWIPCAWLLIGSSRPVSGWFGGSLQRAASFEEGSPLDRTFLTILILLGLFALSKRMQQVKGILRVNLPIVVFLLYCLTSTFWSDFPFVTFKRWIRGAADLVMILVIITDPHWQAALKWVFTRIAFLLIPVSVLLIKYLPEYGRAYAYSGAPMWTGVCNDKNGLGAICMIFGTALLWQILPVSSTQQVKPLGRRELLAKGTVFAMTLYLVWVVDSKTALICFLIANSLIVLTWLGPRFRKPAGLSVIVAGMVISCFAVLFLGIGEGALEAMGRQSDITGRTQIWAAVLPLAQNPVLGVGYESFWIGERYLAFAGALVPLNQSHNGYLEIYLNLGWVGLALLSTIIATGYRNLMAGFQSNLDMGRLKLAFFAVCLVYNFTEATFKMMSPIWITFLWAAMATPESGALSRISASAIQRPTLVQVDRSDV
jgi:exopolysaccharide production protein ExoQ